MKIGFKNEKIYNYISNNNDVVFRFMVFIDLYV